MVQYLKIWICTVNVTVYIYTLPFADNDPPSSDLAWLDRDSCPRIQ